ncbi:NAD-dependent succinate-semialdehyde dehydrogenase [Mycobacterium sp. MHSD3]|jgi:succinate-semialdehyde dehydrogenase / glutarate-semialdehyde dehydrogenase|uniref:NAD-dependent succinate-semialdehyde dehydrogenase n=2 Tax=Mycobacteroides chelonae TaxID=1774 RepID=A0AB73U909_MYCCH|nr:NAD-dependent succinate-semialdehyde dehydrogenase [Mycobacteroides chelonae]AYM43984.1 NAD-dependent succinate-semialdehyde dehydrogenase [[Mycobacterium] chelonae subsp. gwanakae]PKQ59850.1 NAD-dependent succinate-semialdehyde dehydrogenase [Mycobacterium sp. MHSD3]SKN27594.1 Succinate-semialdehyde dehydrogenase [Mycobacteroides abscessus subsp. bolletii]MBF9318488.1 NAD-dependent succinate-semialdehyde dehydrogenase [Mycobacteroides chelonae]MBF9329486.1 NAD-dependent succinate-semialdeh
MHPGAVSTPLSTESAVVAAALSQQLRHGPTFPVVDPSTEEVLADVANMDGRAALTALSNAVAVQRSWASTSPQQRADILMRAYTLMIESTEDLALLMTLEMGKPLTESRGEVTYAAEFFRWFAGEAVRQDGGVMLAPDGGSRLIVTHRPVGPCLLITPWNFPLAMGTRKIGPALAAGCTCLVKPAEQTPLSMLALLGILREAGVPDGVVSVITTADPGPTMAPLLADPRVRKLSFTGSTEVGRYLLTQCAPTVKRTSMELGGNAPFIVFDDADPEEAAAGALIAKMRNIGQACTAANRIYVQRGVAGAFTEALTAKLGALHMGRGTQPGVDVGPLIDPDAVAKADRLVTDARKRGATVRLGGEIPDGAGYFYPPSLLTDVPDDSDMMRTEIFAPVAAIASFDTEEEVIARANDSEFGLVAYLYTNDARRGWRVSEQLETGMVGLNRPVVSTPAAPFGGVKQSGIGREGGFAGIEEFLETKYIGAAV